MAAEEKTAIEPAATVYLGLGGNVGDVAAQLSAAIGLIEAIASVKSLLCAPMWKTAAIGPVMDQPDFLNTGLELLIEGDEPVAFLAKLQAIEAALGRQRSQVGGPRTIDIDVLLWGQRVCTLPGPPEIILPHPHLCERAFALAPLVTLGGRDLFVPGSELTAGELLDGALGDSAQAIERWERGGDAGRAR